MEVFVFEWWWRSYQSPAHKGLRILRFFMVPWKDKPEPTIKCCMGGQIDVVQKFIRIQNLGQNWWWADVIRGKYFPRIFHIAALKQSPRVAVKMKRRTRKIHWTDHLHVDFQRHHMEISRPQKKCESSVQLVSLCAKKFSSGQWSFLGPKCDPSQTVERGSTVREIWHRCVSPGLMERAPLAGGTCGATVRFFF